MSNESEPKARLGFELHAPFPLAGDQVEATASLIQGFREQIPYQTLLGVTGSGKTFTMAHVIAALQRPTLILAHNKTLAAQLYSEMRAFFPNNAVEYFVSYYDYYQPEAYLPSSDTFIEKTSAINEQIDRLRLSATRALLERSDVIVIASVSAIYGLGSPETFRALSLSFRIHELYDCRELLRTLAAMQYRRNRVSLQRGEFDLKGEVLDLFPSDIKDSWIRLTFCDERLESITRIDPLTGEIQASLQDYTLYPKTHYVTTNDQLPLTVETIKNEMRSVEAEFVSQGKLLEAQRIRQRTQYDMEMLVELGYCSGIENYTRYFNGQAEGSPPPTLVEYLPEDGLLFIDESHMTIPQLKAMYWGDHSRKSVLVGHGFRLPSAFDNRPLKFEEFEAKAVQTLYVSATPGAYELEKSVGHVIEQIVRPTGLLDPTVSVRPTVNQVLDLCGEIQARVQRHERSLVVTLTKRMAEDLAQYFDDHGIRARFLHCEIDTVERVEILRDLRTGTLDVLVGVNLLREGLDLPEVSLVAILDADKEGFLRSTAAFIQTIGRAARHVNGSAILYGDRITPAMRNAIEESERRRAKQSEYNRRQGQEPSAITKPLRASLQDELGGLLKKTAKHPRVSARDDGEAPSAPTADLNQMCADLEAKMKQAAQRLEFEQAISLQQKLERLKATMPSSDTAGRTTPSVQSRSSNRRKSKNRSANAMLSANIRDSERGYP